MDLELPIEIMKNKFIQDSDRRRKNIIITNAVALTKKVFE